MMKRGGYVSPIQQGFEKIGRGNLTAIAKVFGVSRQAVTQWRRIDTVPKHFIRTFSSLTGISVDRLLESDELAHGIDFEEFSKAAHAAMQRQKA
jgi:hypothetical protein